MAQLESSDAITYDELSAFLSELDVDWVMELMPMETPVSITSISPRNQASRFKKPRCYVRDDILNTQREIAQLQVKLQQLQEKHKLRETLKTSRSSCGLDWRLFASREWSLMNKANQANLQLRKHVDLTSQLIQRILKPIHVQMDTMPKSVHIDSRIVEIDNRAHVYRVLRASLDIRIKGQLDTIVDHCNNAPVGSTFKLHSVNWKTFTLENCRVGVEFQELITLPFSRSFIDGVINRWPSLNTLEILNPNESASEQAKPQSKPSVMNPRLLLRSVVIVRNRTIMLWEDAFRFQSGSKYSSVLVRGSGWALIAPVVQHEDELSVVHSGGLIQIQASNGSTILPSDVLTKDIVEYAQSMQRSRIASLEGILIDAFREQNRVLSTEANS